MCHATEGTQDYVPVSIPGEALDAHRSHGDGLVGGAVPLGPGMIFSADCTPMLIPSARGS